MQVTAYMLEVLAGDLAYPSYNRRSQFESTVVNQTRPSEAIFTHSLVRLKLIFPKLSALKHMTKLLELRAEVCNNCFSHKIYWYDSIDQNFNEQLFHECDNAWVLDHSDWLREKESAIAYLNQKTPEFLLALIRLFDPPEVSLFSISYRPPEKATSELIRKAWLMAMKKDDLPGQDVLLGVKDLIPPEAKRAINEPRHIRLPEQYDTDLLRRACEDRQLVIREYDMLDFFSRTASTSMIVQIGEEDYYVRMLF